MSPRRARAGTTAPALARSLLAVVDQHGADRRLILPAAALSVVLLGAGESTRRLLLRSAAAHRDPVGVVRTVLRSLPASAPYLAGHLGPLTDLLDDAAPVALMRELLEVLTVADLTRLADDPLVGGDLLGWLYPHVMTPGDREARGAFYTPSSVGGLLAELVPLREGQVFYEPCVGCGGLAVAAIRAARRSGLAPESVRWVLGDIDRLALACAGIQMAAHGMTEVELRSGDALSGRRGR